MPEVDEKVMEFVEDTLKKNPRIQLENLYERAKKFKSSVGRLSRRQFNARYPLQVKRRRALAEKAKGGGKKKGAAGIIFTMVLLIAAGLAAVLFSQRPGDPFHPPPDPDAEPHPGAVEAQGREMLMELRNIEAKLAELENAIAQTPDPGERESLRREAENLFRARDQLDEELNRLGIRP
mgnify:CR=1 FL=1